MLQLINIPYGTQIRVVEVVPQYDADGKVMRDADGKILVDHIVDVGDSLTLWTPEDEEADPVVYESATYKLKSVTGDVPEIVRALESQGIAFKLSSLRNGHVNVFFGHADCIRVLEIFGDKSLSDYTKEEDFILGVMLGYGRLEECRRFIMLSEKENARLEAAD